MMCVHHDSNHDDEQVSTTDLPTGKRGLLFQVMDTGPGLRGKDFRTLFDPLLETGTTP